MRMSAIGKDLGKTSQACEAWERFNSVPRILELLRMGLKKKAIAGRFGVSRETIYKTLEDFGRVARDLESLAAGGSE